MTRILFHLHILQMHSDKAVLKPTRYKTVRAKRSLGRRRRRQHMSRDGESPSHEEAAAAAARRQLLRPSPVNLRLSAGRRCGQSRSAGKLFILFGRCICLPLSLPLSPFLDEQHNRLSKAFPSLLAVLVRPSSVRLRVRGPMFAAAAAATGTDEILCMTSERGGGGLNAPRDLHAVFKFVGRGGLTD